MNTVIDWNPEWIVRFFQEKYHPNTTIEDSEVIISLQDFYFSKESGKAINFDKKSKTDVIKNFVRDFWNLGFKREKVYTKEYINFYQFNQDNLYCTVADSKIIWNEYLTVACEKIDTQYIQTLLTPIAKSLPDKSEFVIFWKPEIQKNSNNTYEIATIRIGGFYATGAVAIMYRIIWSEWKFFHITQELFSCKQFNTDELKEAFSDSKCYTDSIGNSAVLSEYLEKNQK